MHLSMRYMTCWAEVNPFTSKNNTTRNECQSMKHNINACDIQHGTPQAKLNDLFA